MDNSKSEPLLLNLGSGAKVSTRMINIDWSLRLVISRSKILQLASRPFLSDSEYNKIRAIGKNVLVHDLRKGIPFPNNSSDLVYHSHVLEHIDRENVGKFLTEIFRVLKPGGILRICVPDLWQLVQEYTNTYYHASSDSAGRAAMVRHEQSISEMFEQCVRREAAGFKNRGALRRFLEGVIVGDARRRGETHQWMYDFVNLKLVLEDAGFVDIKRQSPDQSDFDDWAGLNMERESSGEERKPYSLYVECRKAPSSG